MEINLKGMTPLLRQATAAVQAPSPLNAAALGFIKQTFPQIESLMQDAGARCAALQRATALRNPSYAGMEARWLPVQAEAAATTHSPVAPRRLSPWQLSRVVVAPGTVR